MHAILNLLLMLIRIYIWMLIAQAILSWLLAFGVVNRYNRAVAVIGDFLFRATEPALRPIRFDIGPARVDQPRMARENGLLALYSIP